MKGSFRVGRRNTVAERRMPATGKGSLRGRGVCSLSLGAWSAATAEASGQQCDEFFTAGHVGRVVRSSVALQGELNDARVARREGSFAVGEIEVPDAHEARIETEPANRRLFAQEALPPAAQGFRIVEAELALADHRKAGRRGGGAELTAAGQEAAGEDVLLDEIGRAHIAIEEVVANRDALEARLALRLETGPEDGEEVP